MMVSYLLVVFLVFLASFIQITDANTAWAQVSVPASSFSYVSVNFWSSYDAIAVGNQFSGGAMIVTNDSGISWSTVSYNGTLGPLYDVTSHKYSDINYILSVDYNGNMYLSTDNATSFSNVFTNAFGALIGVSVGSNNEAYTCGQGNRIYKSSVSSNFSTWTTISTGIATGIFYDISSYDGVNIITVTSSGSIYYSTDSASTWTKGTSSASSSTVIYCVDHGSNSIAMAGGSNGYLSITYDNGATWSSITPFSSSVTIRFHSVTMLNSTEAFVAGSNGEIWRTLDAGSNWQLEASTGDLLYSIGVWDTIIGVAGATSLSGVYTQVTGKY